MASSVLIVKSSNATHKTLTNVLSASALVILPSGIARRNHLDVSLPLHIQLARIISVYGNARCVRVSVNGPLARYFSSAYLHALPTGAVKCSAGFSPHVPS